MNVRMSCCALFVGLVAHTSLFGQVKPDQLEAVRSALKALEQQLAPDPFKDSPEEKRTSRIGEASRAPEAPRAERLVIKIYDMSDLFAITPSYPAVHHSELKLGERRIFAASEATQSGTGGFGGGGFGGGGGGFGGGGGGPGSGGMFDVAETAVPRSATLHQFGGSASPPSESAFAAARTSIEDLINVIQSTIAVDDWRDQGGRGSIERLGSSLVISATEATHQQIGQLLSLLRERWGTLRTVFVRASWLWLTERQLNELLVEPAVPEGRGKMIAEEPYATIKEDKWSELLEKLSRSDMSDPFAVRGNYFAALSCYNGQTVHAMNSGEQLSVTGLTPMFGDSESGSAVGYQPTTAAILQGVAFQVTPFTSLNGKYVVLDIHSRVNRVVDDPKSAASGDKKLTAAEEATRALDKTLVLGHHLSTTLRIPTNRVVLVGGMTADPVPTSSSPQLYLFIKAAVQELRDDPIDKPEPAAKR